jgi:hypothetical protein
MTGEWPVECEEGPVTRPRDGKEPGKKAIGETMASADLEFNEDPFPFS